MKTWVGDYADIFVYDDNTVGFRPWQNEIELDLDIADPEFFTKAQSWLECTKKKKEAEKK